MRDSNLVYHVNVTQHGTKARLGEAVVICRTAERAARRIAGDRFPALSDLHYDFAIGAWCWTDYKTDIMVEELASMVPEDQDYFHVIMERYPGAH